jgi:hypothetical protein
VKGVVDLGASFEISNEQSTRAEAPTERTQDTTDGPGEPAGEVAVP